MDITKCNGKDCPLKESCYRYTASKSLRWQSYFAVTPYDFKEGTCKHYWKK